MDIQILLSLQDFRNGAGGMLSDFMAKMTFLGELNSVIVIMALIYWCVSKELGTYLLMGWSGNRLVNGALKGTVCAYRPWIRDPRILPYGNAITTATGYSFPSGHTMNGATVFGGGAMRRDLPGILRAVSGVLVALIAFSRIFLGVHTPQDVLVGAGAGMLVMFLTLRLMNWIAAHPEKDWLVAAVGLCLGAAVAVYAAVKKTVSLPPLISLVYETIFFAPIALGVLIWMEATGRGALAVAQPYQYVLLLFCGLLTVTPLALFAWAAQLIPLFTIGLMEYISPTISMFLGIFLFHEPFDGMQLLTFAIIWVGLVFFSVGEYRGDRENNKLLERDK